MSHLRVPLLLSAGLLPPGLLSLALLSGCPTSTTPVTDAGTSDAFVSPDAFAPVDAFVSPDAGAPVDSGVIDVDAARPRADLVLRATGETALEGQTVRLRVLDTSIGASSDWYEVTVTSGAFELTLPDGFYRDLFGMIVLAYVDEDGDDTCDTGTDEAFETFVSNDFGAGAQEGVLSFGPPDSSITCDDATTR